MVVEFWGHEFKVNIVIGCIGGFLIALYYLFPSFVVKVFYGSQYLGISSLIVIFAIAMLFFSLSYALAFYNLSIHRTNFMYFLVIFNIVEKRQKRKHKRKHSSV